VPGGGEATAADPAPGNPAGHTGTPRRRRRRRGQGRTGSADH
jgi:hypothetical protein